VLTELHIKRPFDFQEIDIIKPEAQPWRDLYDMDVPVVCLPMHTKTSDCSNTNEDSRSMLAIPKRRRKIPSWRLKP
jgi:hypothetical protein